MGNEQKERKNSGWGWMVVSYPQGVWLRQEGYWAYERKRECCFICVKSEVPIRQLNVMEALGQCRNLVQTKQAQRKPWRRNKINITTVTTLRDFSRQSDSKKDGGETQRSTALKGAHTGILIIATHSISLWAHREPKSPIHGRLRLQGLEWLSWASQLGVGKDETAKSSDP